MRLLTAIGTALAALVAAGVIGGAVARSVAIDVVRPVEGDVTTLKAQRVEDNKDLDEIKRDVKELLRRVR